MLVVNMKLVHIFLSLSGYQKLKYDETFLNWVENYIGMEGKRATNCTAKPFWMAKPIL